MKQPKFFVLSFGLGTERGKSLVERCIQSVKDYLDCLVKHIVLLDDPDNPRGKAFNFWCTLNGPDMAHADPMDVIMMVDADDYIEKGCYGPLKSIYANSGIWVTHGSYRTLSGKPARFNGSYPHDADVRSYKWRASHLKTFRVGLAKMLPDKIFKGPDGAFLRCTDDLSMMFSLIEMAGLDRTTYIPSEIYVYDDTNPESDHKLRPDFQKEMERHIRNSPRLSRIKGIS
jgi:hypothetical protein